MPHTPGNLAVALTNPVGKAAHLDAHWRHDERFVWVFWMSSAEAKERFFINADLLREVAEDGCDLIQTITFVAGFYWSVRGEDSTVARVGESVVPGRTAGDGLTRNLQRSEAGVAFIEMDDR